MTKLSIVALASLLLVPSLAGTQNASAESTPEQIAAGQELFTHLWIENDPLSEMGDGLGPVYNDRSCVACHFQSGTGGSGPSNQNVDILSVQIPSVQNAGRRSSFIAELTSLHAGFQSPAGAIPSITLHAHGTNKAYYERRRDMLSKVGETESSTPSRLSIIEELFETSDTDLEFEHTQRNTPALFGSGVLDRVSESVMRRTQERLNNKYPQVSGRLARIVSSAGGSGSIKTERNDTRRFRRGRSTAKIGRFGWRGQISTLDEFVRGACANELGLAVSTQPQPVDPTAPTTDLVLDLTDSQCKQLTAYVASLPAPTPKWPADETQRRMAEDGQVVFERIGCNSCHVENLGPAKFVYSDLLLHDMGSGLSDPFPAPSDTTISTTPGYYGGLQTIFSTTPVSQTQREWRTPPLWGSADSAPYMHDGRAKTFADAILAHGGEAEFCVTKYITSSPRDRLTLIAFLETLQAPSPPDYDPASHSPRVAAK